jgi:hypothetical protein
VGWRSARTWISDRHLGLTLHSPTHLSTGELFGRANAKRNACMPQSVGGHDGKSRTITTNGRYRRPLCTIPGTSGQMDDDVVKEINPDFDALLVFLANWEAIERSALGRILTAGQLADVLELERMFELPSGTPEDSL